MIEKILSGDAQVAFCCCLTDKTKALKLTSISLIDIKLRDDHADPCQ